METTNIKKNSPGKFKNGIQADKKILNGSFREKLNDMIKNQDTSGKLKAIEKIAENTVKLGFEKAVAHFENPALYPLPQGDKDLEKAVYDLLNVLPKKKRNKLIDKINELLKAPADKREQVYGEIVNVDFRSSESIAEQVKKIPALKKYSLTENEIKEFNSSLKTHSANNNLPQPQQAASAGTLGYFVDSMTCLNPDDVVKDEVTLGGFIIDSFGNNINLEPRFVGNFRRNETISLGANNKLFTVTIDPNAQQQTFVANLFIIEGDLVSNQAALDKLILVLGIIALTLGLVAFGIVIAGSLGAAVTFMQFYVTFFTAAGIGLFDINILPLIGDDISNITEDTLLLDGRIEIGQQFARTIQIGQGFDSISTFDGKYIASARWVGEN